MHLPIASCRCDLCGKDPRRSSLSPERSTMEINMMPVKDASTPTSFFVVKDSTWNIAPNIKVKILLVEVKMVELATLVYSRHAATK